MTRKLIASLPLAVLLLVCFLVMLLTYVVEGIVGVLERVGYWSERAIYHLEGWAKRLDREG